MNCGILIAEQPRIKHRVNQLRPMAIRIRPDLPVSSSRIHSTVLTLVRNRCKPRRASPLSRDRGGVQQAAAVRSSRMPPPPAAAVNFSAAGRLALAAAVLLSFRRPRATRAASIGGESRSAVRWMRVGSSRWRSWAKHSAMPLLTKERRYQK
jgi:hypothetical protein